MLSRSTAKSKAWGVEAQTPQRHTAVAAPVAPFVPGSKWQIAHEPWPQARSRLETKWTIPACKNILSQTATLRPTSWPLPKQHLLCHLRHHVDHIPMQSRQKHMPNRQGRAFRRIANTSRFAQAERRSEEAPHLILIGIFATELLVTAATLSIAQSQGIPPLTPVFSGRPNRNIFLVCVPWSMEGKCSHPTQKVSRPLNLALNWMSTSSDIFQLNIAAVQQPLGAKALGCPGLAAVRVRWCAHHEAL